MNLARGFFHCGNANRRSANADFAKQFQRPSRSSSPKPSSRRVTIPVFAPSRLAMPERTRYVRLAVVEKYASASGFPAVAVQHSRLHPIFSLIQFARRAADHGRVPAGIGNSACGSTGRRKLNRRRELPHAVHIPAPGSETRRVVPEIAARPFQINWIFHRLPFAAVTPGAIYQRHMVGLSPHFD